MYKTCTCKLKCDPSVAAILGGTMGLRNEMGKVYSLGLR